MIRYALECEEGHGFEAWFGSSETYDEQAEAQAIVCPSCGSVRVGKAPMAPYVGGPSEAPHPQAPKQAPRPKSYAMLRKLREEMTANAEDVGANSRKRRARSISRRWRPATSMARRRWKRPMSLPRKASPSARCRRCPRIRIEPMQRGRVQINLLLGVALLQP